MKYIISNGNDSIEWLFYKGVKAYAIMMKGSMGIYLELFE